MPSHFLFIFSFVFESLNVLAPFQQRRQQRRYRIRLRVFYARRKGSNVEQVTCCHKHAGGLEARKLAVGHFEEVSQVLANGE